MPLLVAGVLVTLTLLGGCGGSSQGNSSGAGNSLQPGSIVSEKATVESVDTPLGAVYVLKGDSGRMYEDFSNSLTPDLRQVNLRVSFTAVVVAPAGSPGGSILGIPVHITQISKI